MALEDAVWKRVHPSSLAFRFASHVKTLIVPGLLVLWLARGSRWELLGFVLFLPSVAIEVVRYLSLRYCLAGGEVVVREGLVFKNERHIPFQRIQNIDLVQNVVQRALGVAEVRVENASGSEPEAEFRVLTLADVAEMRRRVFAGREPQPASAAQATAEPSAGVLLLRIPTRELLLLGLVSDRGLALAAVAIALVLVGLRPSPTRHVGLPTTAAGERLGRAARANSVEARALALDGRDRPRTRRCAAAGHARFARVPQRRLRRRGRCATPRAT